MNSTTAQIEQFVSNAVAAYKDLVAGQSVTAIDRVRQALADYRSELLPAIDERLAACSELLRRGLRAEALSYAHDRPDLLRIANLVDFRRFGPEFDKWNMAAAAEGVAAWPLPNGVSLEALQRAEHEAVTLKPFVDQWRRLNLARAPLARRIEILRELRKRDSNDMAWAEMLREFEQFRLTQIEAIVRELRAASPENQALCKQATAVKAELSTPWIEVPAPLTLLREVEQFLVKATAHQRERRLVQLAAEIEGAVDAGDECGVDRLLAEWVEIPLTADEGQRFASILEIEKQRADRKRLSRLTDELTQLVAESQASFAARSDWGERLKRQWHELDDLTAVVPIDDEERERLKLLHDRVWTAIEAIEREQWIRRGVQLGAIAAAVLLAVGISLSYVWQVQRERLVVESVDRLNEAAKEVEAGGVFDEPKFYSDWPTWLGEDPRVDVAIDRLSSAFASQQSRREKLQRLLERADKELKEARSEPRDDPLTAWPNSFLQAARTVTDLQRQGLAKLELEQAKVRAAESQLTSLVERWLAAADTVFAAKVSGLAARAEGFSQGMRDDVAASRDRLANLDAEFASLQAVARQAACEGVPPPYAQMHRVSPKAAELVAEGSAVGAQLRELRRLLIRFEGLEEREKVADRQLGLGQLGAYADTIRGIAEDLAGTDEPESLDYRLVANEQPAWESLQKWEKFCRELEDPASLDAGGCERFNMRIEELDDGARRLPYSRQLRDLQQYLRAGAAQTPDKVAALAEKIAEVLQGRFGTEISGVMGSRDRASDLNYAYCLLKDRPDGKRVNNNAKQVVGWPTDGVWPTKTFEFDPQKHFVADAPQHVLAALCLAEVNALQPNASGPQVLDRHAVRLLRKAVTAQKAFGAAGGAKATPPIDPCMQFLQVRFLVLACASVNENIKAFLPQTFRAIEAGNDGDGFEVQLRNVANRVFANILKPDAIGSFELGKARQACEKFLETLGKEIDSLEEKLQEKYKQIAGLEFVWYECVGRLRKRHDGGWEIRGGRVEQRQHKEVFIVDAPFPGSAAKPLVQCDAAGQMPAGVDVVARAGAPVYVEQRIVLGAITKQE